MAAEQELQQLKQRIRSELQSLLNNELDDAERYLKRQEPDRAKREISDAQDKVRRIMNSI